MNRIDEDDWRNYRKKSSFEFKYTKDPEFPCILPASPNWYCSSISSCMNGYLVLGSKWAVYLVNLQHEPPICEMHLFGSTGYSCKVTSVTLFDIGDNEDISSLPSHCALGMEDGLLKLVDCKTKQTFKEHRRHKVKVSALCWSSLSSKLIVSGDEKGVISIWNINESSISVWTPIPNAINCMEMSPYLVHHVAIGYRNGNILLCDFLKIQILQNFKSHIDEVCTLSWCPVSKQEDYNFVSSSKDRTLRVWSILQEKSVCTYSIPRNMPGKKKDETQRGKAFIAVQWIKENQILSSHSSGDLLAWNRTNGKWNVMGDGHNRMVFSIKKDQLTGRLVTVSIDRQLIIWDEASLQPEHKIPTIGGFAYSLSSTPLDPHSIAIGSGDHLIRVWSTGDPQHSYFSTTLWQGIKTKVMVVLFHPIREAILGFATEGGHVGCYSVLSQKSDIAASYHRKAVYSLSWGPSCLNSGLEDKHINCLYSIGSEGTLLVNKMGAFNQDAVNVSTLIKERNKIATLNSEIAWRGDYMFVAVGNEDGSINVFARNFYIVCTIDFHKKLINTLSWHHTFSGDTPATQFSCWLASGCDGHSVCVFDLSNFLLKDAKRDEVISVHTPFRHFTAQNDRITKVAWNPHKNGVLAVSSFESTVQVWDVVSNEGIANYRGHIGRVYTVMWCYTDGDVLYSGGDDFAVHRWRISQQMHTLPPTGKNKTRSKKNKPKKDSNVTKAKIEEHQMEALEPVDEQLNINVIPKNGFKDGEKKKRRVKSLLKKSALADAKKKEIMQADCVMLAKYLKEANEQLSSPTKMDDIQPSINEHVNFGLYASRRDAFKMIQSECEGHKENNSIEQLLQLEVWRGNICGYLKEAVEEDCLNETLVALSPMGGFDMWRACMLAYAEQLEKKRNFNMAAVYYLAFGDKYKAINVFKDNSLFKEALTLAKLQLLPDDPLLNELYTSWAHKLIEDKNIENAAECYLACEKINEAISVLAKRQDSASLLTAIQIADIYSLNQRAQEYLPRCINLLIYENKWDVCNELLERVKPVQLSHLRAVVNELLVEYLTDSELVSSTEKLDHNEHRYHTRELHDGSFLVTLLTLLKSLYNISADNVMAILEHSGIDSLYHQVKGTKFTSYDSKQVTHYVTDNVLFGVLSLLKSDVSGCLKAWLQAFNILLLSGYVLTMIQLFEFLFPRFKNSFDELVREYASLQTDAAVDSLFGNFIAFRNIGLLYRSWWNGIPPADIQDMQNSLLSSEYYDCIDLTEKLEKIEEKILEADIKKRLHQHIRKKESSTKEAVKMCLEDIINTVHDLVANGDYDNTTQLAHEEILLKELLNSCSSFVRDYSFPDPRHSARVLLCVPCCYGLQGEILRWCSERGMDFGEYKFPVQP